MLYDIIAHNAGLFFIASVCGNVILMFTGLVLTGE